MNKVSPVSPVESLPFESLMVRVPHHDPEHGGSIFLATLSLSMGRKVRAVSLLNRQVEQQNAPCVSPEPAIFRWPLTFSSLIT